jgi:ParB/RepB/Spo0J family partition protein
MQLELRFLQTPYERLRPRDRTRERELVASLEAHGQQRPIVVVTSSTAGQFVVIDGHRRIRALTKLGRDLVAAHCLPLSAGEALVEVRVRHLAPRLSALEEGWLVRELVEQQGRSPEEVARVVGRSERWVVGRLQLARDLPTPLEELVSSGRLSLGAVTRLVIPVARAYPARAVEFGHKLAGARLCGQAIARLARMFHHGSLDVRQVLVADPVRLLRAQEEDRQTVPPHLEALELHERSAIEALEELTRRTRAAAARLEALQIEFGTSPEFDQALQSASERLDRETTELWLRLSGLGMRQWQPREQEGDNKDAQQADACSRSRPASEERIRNPQDSQGPGDLTQEGQGDPREPEPGSELSEPPPAARATPGDGSLAVSELQGQRLSGGRGTLREAPQTNPLLDRDALLPPAQVRSPEPHAGSGG